MTTVANFLAMSTKDFSADIIANVKTSAEAYALWMACITASKKHMVMIGDRKVAFYKAMRGDKNLANIEARHAYLVCRAV